MKKFLITIAPFVVLFFLFILFLWGLKRALAVFCVVLFTVALAYALAFLLVKWTDFVDKHIKD